MPEVPECLSRRYKAIDDLMNDISTAMPGYLSGPEQVEGVSDGGQCCGGDPSSRCSSATSGKTKDNEVGIKLMCDFWKMLQDDPDYNPSVRRFFFRY